MNPSADVLALASIEVDISSIAAGQGITVKWRGKPVFIRHRTPKAIEEARSTMRKRPSGATSYRSEEHTSELQSLMRSSYDVFCLKTKTAIIHQTKPALTQLTHNYKY